MLDKFIIVDRALNNREGYGCEEVTPRGHVSLMDLYENNFLRLKKLAPNLERIESDAVSRLPGCLDVHISVIERSQFTTTLTMTYLFEEEGRQTAEPNLKLRVYHDASLVEVVAGHLKHGRQRVDHLPASALKLKWRLNRFLYKWLGYCLYLGHEFSEDSADIGTKKTGINDAI